jgi:hypothetical protein
MLAKSSKTVLDTVCVADTGPDLTVFGGPALGGIEGVVAMGLLLHQEASRPDSA